MPLKQGKTVFLLSLLWAFTLGWVDLPYRGVWGVCGFGFSLPFRNEVEEEVRETPRENKSRAPNGRRMGKVVQLTEQIAKLEGFDLFWEMYPRKKKKGDAFKAWQQTVSIRPSIEEILAAIQQQERSHQWTKDGGEFIPYPASWLRAWGWADED